MASSRLAYELLVWGIYFGGLWASACWASLLCVAFGLVNILLGRA